jgi:hypothetical protein
MLLRGFVSKTKKLKFEKRLFVGAQWLCQVINVATSCGSNGVNKGPCSPRAGSFRMEGLKQ